MTRFVILLLVALLGVAAGCSWVGPASPTITGPAGATLTIRIMSGSTVLRTRTLRCDPPAGTTPRPAAACAALRDDLRHASGAHAVCHCPAIFADSRYAVISGRLDGRRILIRFGPCACGLRHLHDLRIVTGLRSFSPPAG